MTRSRHSIAMLLLLAGIALLTPAVSYAQRNPTQPQGEQAGTKSPAPAPTAEAAPASQRKAILDALRVPIERNLKQSVVFAVQKYAVIGDWAFVMATPKRPDGGEIAWARTVCRGDVSHLVGGLMKREGGRWIVRDYALCPTDVAWDGWPEQHGAPRALFQ